MTTQGLGGLSFTFVPVFVTFVGIRAPVTVVCVAIGAATSFAAVLAARGRRALFCLSLKMCFRACDTFVQANIQHMYMQRFLEQINT
jgi:hypothetical protein